MSINQISSSNTFAQWLVATQALIENWNFVQNTANSVNTTANIVSSTSNSINILSNLVFMTSNSVNSKVDSVNTSANIVFMTANSINSSANIVYMTSNAVNSIVSFIYLTSNNVNNKSNSVNIVSNAVYNTSNNINTSFIYIANTVNSAFAQANTAMSTKANLSGAIFSGDIRTYRSSAANTGVLYFGQVGSNYLYYDGNAFHFSSSNVSAPYFIGNATSSDYATVAGSVNYGVLSNQNTTFTKAQRGSYTILTDDVIITPDFNLNNMFRVQLGGNRTMAYPSNVVAGQSGCIDIYQDSTGSRTLSFSVWWQFPGGSAPTLSTNARSKDKLLYSVDVSGQSQTVTITIASPGVISWAAHGLMAGQPITFSTTGSLPTGLTPGAIYFVIPVDMNSLKLSTTQSGTPITTTGSQNGVHTAFLAAITGNLLKGIA